MDCSPPWQQDRGGIALSWWKRAWLAIGRLHGLDLGAALHDSRVMT